MDRRPSPWPATTSTSALAALASALVIFTSCSKTDAPAPGAEPVAATPDVDRRLSDTSTQKLEDYSNELGVSVELAGIGPSLQLSMLDLSKATKPVTAAQAIKVLSQGWPSPGAETLRAAAKHWDPCVRWNAYGEMVHTENLDFLPDLLVALSDSDFGVRLVALAGLDSWVDKFGSDRIRDRVNALPPYAQHPTNPCAAGVIHEISGRDAEAEEVFTIRLPNGPDRWCASMRRGRNLDATESLRLMTERVDLMQKYMEPMAELLDQGPNTENGREYAAALRLMYTVTEHAKAAMVLAAVQGAEQGKTLNRDFLARSNARLKGIMGTVQKRETELRALYPELPSVFDKPFSERESIEARNCQAGVSVLGSSSSNEEVFDVLKNLLGRSGEECDRSVLAALVALDDPRVPLFLVNRLERSRFASTDFIEAVGKTGNHVSACEALARTGDRLLEKSKGQLSRSSAMTELSAVNAALRTLSTRVPAPDNSRCADLAKKYTPTPQ